MGSSYSTVHVCLKEERAARERAATIGACGGVREKGMSKEASPEGVKEYRALPKKNGPRSWGKNEMWTFQVNPKQF